MAGQCSDLEQTVQDAENAPMRMAVLKKELKNIEGVLGDTEGEYTDFQQMLLERVSGYCQTNKLVLKEFPQPISKIENDYEVQTNIVVVEGPYDKLLDLLHTLEQRDRMGKVAGVEFRTEKELRTKRLKLTAAIYLQNVKKISDEV